MKHIFLVTDQLSGKKWSYGSIAAMIRHMDNPLDVTDNDVHNERRRQPNKDFPITLDGCLIEKIRVWSAVEVRADFAQQ